MVQHRAYFRIDTVLSFSYRVLTDEEATRPLPIDVNSAFIERYFPNALSEIETRVQQTIDNIRGKSSLMAEALDALIEKLDYIMHGLGQDAIKHSLPTVPVNISAGGLSFSTNDAISSNATIDLLIYLNTQAEPLLIRSHVVNVIPLPNACFSVSVEFIDMMEETRRQLIYFIQTKELELAHLKQVT